MLAVSLTACTRSEPPARSAESGPAETQPAAAGPAIGAAPECTLDPRPTRLPAAGRVVAIGDVHGDLNATLAALRLAGAVDQDGRWIGGELVLVQTGDILDRGDDEQAIIDLFERLEGEAAAAGGRVVVLNGNHEFMNAAGDLRYVTAGGYRDFDDAPGVDPAAAPAGIPAPARARVAALGPGGVYARVLADRRTVAVVGDTLFVHGGITGTYAGQLDEINRSGRCWLKDGGPQPAWLGDPEGPVWTRAFSRGEDACAALEAALEAAGVSRMVVGHTPQDHINAGCDGKVWRIDVGLASFYGGPIEVLELTGDRAAVLAAPRPK
ncbi:MAG TPA: metallophosphoesterase [Kofleriaceae bacterium]|nr:metallophosphoesterase [Kofleriaceae bacterium]